MKIDMLAGQMLMVGFDGCEFSSEHLELLKEVKPSGIILFGRNMVDSVQVRNLISDFKRSALSLGLPPLIVAVDYEGGVVFRIGKDVTPLPSAMAIGATGNAKYAEIIADVAGKELRWMGFNMNLAPVADVNSNPMNPIIGVRSFGDDPKLVASFVKSYISSLQSHMVMAVAKHFPGHGATEVDSHLDLPVVNEDVDILLRRELIPFKAAINSNVAAIMTAHVSFPKIDPSGLPATLSKAIINGLLREMLGYDGLVVSDALEMKAISDRFDVEEVVKCSVNAGVDLLLISRDIDLMVNVKDCYVKVLKDGSVDKRHVLKSFQRLKNLRAKFYLYYSKLKANVSSTFSNKHSCMVFNVCKRSLTLISGSPLHIDFSASKFFIFMPNRLKIFLSKFVGNVEKYFSKILAGKVRAVRFLSYDDEHLIDDPCSYLIDIGKDDLTIFFLYNAIFNRGQLNLYRKIRSCTSNLIAVVAGIPYDAVHVRDADAVYATYGLTPLQLKALGWTVFKGIKPSGTLPVKLSLNV